MENFILDEEIETLVKKSEYLLHLNGNNPGLLQRLVQGYRDFHSEIKNLNVKIDEYNKKEELVRLENKKDVNSEYIMMRSLHAEIIRERREKANKMIAIYSTFVSLATNSELNLKQYKQEIKEINKISGNIILYLRQEADYTSIPESGMEKARQNKKRGFRKN